MPVAARTANQMVAERVDKAGDVDGRGATDDHSMLRHLFSAMRVSVVFSMIGIAVCEAFGQRYDGVVGAIYLESVRELDALSAFTGFTLVSVIGVALYLLVVLGETIALPSHDAKNADDAGRIFD